VAVETPPDRSRSGGELRPVLVQGLLCQGGPFQPWHASCPRLATGGLRFPDLTQRRRHARVKFRDRPFVGCTAPGGGITTNGDDAASHGGGRGHGPSRNDAHDRRDVPTHDHRHDRGRP
jgi:hypothetical protein